MSGTLKYRHCVNEHEHCDYDEVKTGKRLRQSLIVTCQTQEAVVVVADAVASDVSLSTHFSPN